MKYLKLYNESYLKNDLEEFCKDNLSYLLDDYLNLSIIKDKNIICA